MAHELEIRKDGTASMFYVGDAPWHGLGTALENPPTVEEAIRLAGLDWEVNLKPIVLKETQEDCPAQATVRDSDGKILGVVGMDYKVLQNSKAFEWFNPLIESGLVTLETAGSLRGGKRIWILAKVKGISEEVIPGDKLEAYILLAQGHDGKMGIHVGFSPVRTVCMNTLRMAMDHASSKLIRVKHRGNVEQTLAMIRDAMDIAAGEFKATVDQYKALASKHVSREDLEKYVKIVFQTKAQENSENACERIIAKVVDLSENGRGASIPGVRGTMWGAYNAITEYLQHERGADPAIRLDNTWFGQGSVLNKKAFDTAVEMTKSAA